MSTVAAAGQIFRPTANSDWGIDGEIEFKADTGRASGQRVYLQLKSGDSYTRFRRGGGERFSIKNPEHVAYWRDQPIPVWLVIESSHGAVRWMNITRRLLEHQEDYELRERARDSAHFDEETAKIRKSKSFQNRTKRQWQAYTPPSSVAFEGRPFDVGDVLDVRSEVLAAAVKRRETDVVGTWNPPHRSN